MQLVSIIVPVYNVGKYLERCLKSILQQTYKHFEIILVDDGSTDNSGRVCDEYKEKDDRIRVIHKENKGVSDARNVGLQNVTGDYICFIDPDDVVAPDFLDKLYKLCMEHDADISMVRYRTFTDEIIFDNLHEKKIEVLSSKEVLWRQFGADYVNYIVLWNKMYKANLFDGIVFPNVRQSEDEAVLYRIFYKAERVVVSDEILYGYFMRLSSLTKSNFTEKKIDFLRVARERVHFFDENKETALMEAYQYVYAISLMIYGHRAKKYLKNKVLARELWIEYKKMFPIIKKASTLNGKRKSVICLFRICPMLYGIYDKVTYIMWRLSKNAREDYKKRKHFKE